MSFLFNFLGLVAKAAARPPNLYDAYKDWEEVPFGDYVHKLTDNTLESFVKGHPTVFLFFYSPHCPFCSSMKPDLALAARDLKYKTTSAKIAALNAKAYDPIFNIHGVPTMYYFRFGRFMGEYRKERRADEILNFILTADGHGQQ